MALTALLGVSGMPLTAQLSPANEGQAIGLFNATTALVATLGAALRSGIAGRRGYAAAPELAVFGLACGLLLASHAGRSFTSFFPRQHLSGERTTSLGGTTMRRRRPDVIPVTSRAILADPEAAAR